MQAMFYNMLDVIHEYSYGIGGFSLGIVLLCLLVLIYQDDYKNSFLIYGFCMALFLILCPFLAFYIYTVYGLGWYIFEACFIPVIPLVAYTVFRTVEACEGQKKILALVLSIAIFLLACSYSKLNLKEFKFYKEKSMEKIMMERIIEDYRI